MLFIGGLVWLYLPETSHDSSVETPQRTVGRGESNSGPTADCGYCAEDD
jgi:hypothetical protein